MTRSPSARTWRRSPAAALLICLVLAAGRPAAQAPSIPSAPTLGQSGKDVEWVPTPDDTATKMLDLAQVRASDTVIDLGSGDGKLVIAAAQRGARGLGVEYDANLVALSIERAKQAGLADRTTFLKADLFDVDLSQATVITMFLLPDLNLKLRPRLLQLEPGTRVVSNTWDMEDWEPDATAKLDCPDFCNSLLWIIPARIDGRWRTKDGAIVLSQTYQKFSGTWTRGAQTVTIDGGRLRGDRFAFEAGGARYAGRVTRRGLVNSMTPSSGPAVPFEAMQDTQPIPQP